MAEVTKKHILSAHEKEARAERKALALASPGSVVPEVEQEPEPEPVEQPSVELEESAEPVEAKAVEQPKQTKAVSKAPSNKAKG